jgi:hypothetical protein
MSVENTFQHHFSILPKAQQELWPELSPAPRLGFVLYGGTAVALRLGHRISVDFDFFHEKPLNQDEIYQEFPFMQKAKILQNRDDTLTALVPSVLDTDTYVKISFFGSIGFGRGGIPQYTADGNLQLASFIDLMATKLKVLLQRVEVKDYRDIAAMVQAGVSLEQGLGLCHTLFGNKYPDSEILKALTYFEGGDLATLTDKEKKVLIRTVQNLQMIPQMKILSSTLS